MRRLFTGIACMLCFGAIAQITTKEFQLTISNPSSYDVKNEPVVLRINPDEQQSRYTSATVCVWDEDTQTDVEIPSQLDDLNNDGMAEELVFLIDVPRREERSVTVELSQAKKPMRYPAQVYAEMLLSDKKKGHKPIRSLTVPGDVNVYDNLHHHGPAFESELVAFRVYFDERQTVDIYGKRKQQLEIEQTQFYPTPEHLANGFGDDILWAGTTCALGTFRGYTDNKPSYIQPVDSRTESILAYGPLRTVVEIHDEDWQYNNQTLDLTLRYILYGGHRDAEVAVKICSDEPINSTFCTGLIKLDNCQTYSDHKGTAAVWGDNWPAGRKDTVGRKKEVLGMAVKIPQRNVVGEPENEENMIYLLGEKARILTKELAFSYHIAFASDKEEESTIHSANEWFEWVKQWNKQKLLTISLPEKALEIVSKVE